MKLFPFVVVAVLVAGARLVAAYDPVREMRAAPELTSASLDEPAAEPTLAETKAPAKAPAWCAVADDPVSIKCGDIQRVFGAEVAVVDVAGLDIEQRKTVQRELATRGHYYGAIDGIYGPQTRDALIGFIQAQARLSQKLASTGVITAQTAVALGLPRAELELVRGETDSAW